MQPFFQLKWQHRLIFPLLIFMKLSFASRSQQYKSWKGLAKSSLKVLLEANSQLRMAPCLHWYQWKSLAICNRAGLWWAVTQIWLVMRPDPCPSHSCPPCSPAWIHNTDVHPYRLTLHSLPLPKGLNTTAWTFSPLLLQAIILNNPMQEFIQLHLKKKKNQPSHFNVLLKAVNLLQAAYYSRWLETVF